ncbi:MAG: pilus assembly PilX N-terminal domain-containing protein [Opitutales bacterium]|nr:pilus assembly PilX N-terminal domain-containing protein [Opitutales bacterium]
MIFKTPEEHSTRRRGSTIAVILIFTMAIGLVVASSFNYALTETRLNQSDLLANEARLAAESVLEHGMAQLRRRFDRTHQLTALELRPDKPSALRLEIDFLEFLQHRSGSRVVAPPGLGGSGGPGQGQGQGQGQGANQGSGGGAAWPNHQSFVNRPISLGGLVLNQGDPVIVDIDSNELLPEEGMNFHQSAAVREVRLYARARVNGGRWGNRDAYTRKTFQVIDESLYQFAVYYGDVLEVWPGADMDLAKGGPVYGREIWLGAGAGHTFNVHGRVMAPDGFFIGRHPDSGRNDTPSNEIYLRDLRAGDDSSDYLRRLVDANPHGGHLDSGHHDFRELAIHNYRGGLVTGVHGVTPQSPVGLEAIREMSENAASTAFNPAHHLIQPPRDESFFQSIADEQERELYRTIEQTKWSAQSEVIIDASGIQSGNVVLRDRNGNEIPLDADNVFWEVQPYATEDGNVTSGIYDYRQARNNTNDARGRINLLRLDMAAMREWVEDPSANIPWNGGVYVHMPEVSDPGRDDYVVPANANWAVQLHNGAVLPNRRAVDPEATRGLTLATNSGLYVQGDFNAPSGGGTSTEPEDISTFGEPGHEAPAALVADAVTVLSNNWSNANSRGTSLSGDRPATNTVVSAAIVTGNVPSANNTYSGGVENFPRFLEAWSGRTLTYRGSMINLFRSESFDGPWRFGDRVYNAPTRDWGFNRGFRELTPPLDPGTRVFRQVNFLELTRERFVEETKALYAVQ